MGNLTSNLAGGNRTFRIEKYASDEPVLQATGRCDRKQPPSIGKASNRRGFQMLIVDWPSIFDLENEGSKALQYAQKEVHL
jgi:hypothetical protein